MAWYYVTSLNSVETAECIELIFGVQVSSVYPTLYYKGIGFP